MTSPSPKTRQAETEIVVRSYELDSFSHVNHAVFLNYLEYARFEALRTGGLTREFMAERGWGVYVVRIEVDYLKEARMDDRLLVRTRLGGYRRTSMLLIQEVVRPGDDPEDEDETLIQAKVHAVWVDANRRPMRVPAEVKAALGPGQPSAAANV
jgi:YbgC/YbaW family acyl-CoA thioester hydrolase